MAKYEYVLCVLMLVGVAAGRHHYKLPYNFTERDYRNTKGDYTDVACTVDIGAQREKIIEESRCGKPRDVFVNLVPKTSYEEVSPGAVWVKQCVGLCEFDNSGSCLATERVTRNIQVRVYNAETKQEACALYPVDEHVHCGCIQQRGIQRLHQLAGVRTSSMSQHGKERLPRKDYDSGAVQKLK